MVAGPAAVGVNTPPEVTVPFVADHVTPVLKAPVPVTLAVQEEVCEIKIEVGVQMTDTVVMEVEEELLTVTVVEPDLVVS